MTRAGFPQTTAYEGTSFVTTLPAPTTAPFLIVTPGRITELAPIHNNDTCTSFVPMLFLM